MQLTASRGGVIAALAVTAALAAGCGTAGSNTTASSKSQGAGVSAADAVKLAADQASQTTAMTAGISVRMSGQQPGSMQGTIAMRTKPSLAMEMNLTSVAVGGQSVPGGMRQILVTKGLYLSTPQLSRLAGKPWVLIPASMLNQASGNAFSQLGQQLQQQDPLSSARMLGAATNVRQIGTGTADGVPVTRYSGVIPVQRGLSRLTPQLRNQAQRKLSSMGITTVSFIAALDQQHRIRQLQEWMNGTAERMVTTVSVTGLDQPVSIEPPPASQVGQIPVGPPSSGSGSAPSAGSASSPGM